MATKRGDNFENFVTNMVKCPRCHSKVEAFDNRSYPAIDHYCTNDTCSVVIQAKRNSKNTYESHASSYKAMHKTRQKIGDDNIYFVIGTPTNYAIHQLSAKRVEIRKIRKYRPSSKDLARKTKIRVSTKGKPYGFANWTEVAKFFGLMIKQDCIRFVW